MANDRRLASKIKAQLTKFASQISAGLSAPMARFVTQMLYGIQAAGDVKLSNIARSLNESIRLIKTENRLSRNLASQDLTEHVNERLVKESVWRIGEDTVLAIDPGDLTKKHAKKMENMATVRDGSEGDLSKGYWLCSVVAAAVCSSLVTPLWGELYSCEAEGFKSENAKILSLIGSITKHIGRAGIWTIDRGGDRIKLILELLKRDLRFVIRQRGDRHLLDQRGRKLSCEEIARRCPRRTTVRIELRKDAQFRRLEISIGARRVRLPKRPDDQLLLVVIRGFGQSPVMLLTNLDMKVKRTDLVRLMQIYLTRWKCEESYRFIKQAYNLEDVRVRSYVALRNTVALVQAVFWFVAVRLGQRTKLEALLRQVLERAQRFFEIPSFFYYAVADGLERILSVVRTPLEPPPRPYKCHQQYLPLFSAAGS